MGRDDGSGLLCRLWRKPRQAFVVDGEVLVLERFSSASRPRGLFSRPLAKA